MAHADEVGEWVFLTYPLPRNPSAPRLALWRRLKRLGVAQLADARAALSGSPAERTGALRRLREENRRIRRRDFFRPAQGETAHRLLDEWAASLTTESAEVSS